MPGREADAERAFREGIDAADDSGLRYLFNDFGVFLSNRKRFEEATEAFRRGCAIGDKLACRNLWRAHLATGAPVSDPEAVLQWFQHCTPGEDLEMLGSLLAKQSAAMSERAFVAAIERGRWESLQHLAVLLVSTGQLDRLRRLIAANAKSFSGEQLRMVANALFPVQRAEVAMQGLLKMLGQKPNLPPRGPLWSAAEIFLHEAARKGDREAKFRLGLLLAQDPARAKGAEAAYRDAVAAGATEAYSALGDLLAVNRGRWAEAETIYRQGIEAGDKRCYSGLFLILAQSPGREQEVNDLAARMVELGIVKLPK